MTKQSKELLEAAEGILFIAEAETDLSQHSEKLSAIRRLDLAIQDFRFTEDHAPS